MMYNIGRKDQLTETIHVTPMTYACLTAVLLWEHSGGYTLYGTTTEHETQGLKSHAQQLLTSN
jgi:hypothetical protein